MKVVNIQAAKTHLSRLVEDAIRGEEIVLAKAGRPMVRLTPFRGSGRRKLGLLKGSIVERDDCWERDEVTEGEFSRTELMPSPDPKRGDVP